jgi:hypothetical protein
MTYLQYVNRLFVHYAVKLGRRVTFGRISGEFCIEQWNLISLLCGPEDMINTVSGCFERKNVLKFELLVQQSC